MLRFIWHISVATSSILHMLRLLYALLSFFAAAYSADLPTRKFVNLAAIKTMVAAAEAEAKKLNVEVTICIVDESGNLLFLQKADAAPLNTIEFAQKMKKGHLDVLAFPDFFPNQGGLPIQVDGQTIGAIAASGAKSEIDEAVAQAALDALFKK